MPRRKTSRSRRSYSSRSYPRIGRGGYSRRRQPVRRKSRVSKRASASSRPQRLVIEVRQAPAAVNPLEGMLAAQAVSSKPKKARF